MTPLVAGLIGIALGIVLIAAFMRRRRSNDAVNSFRRGLDALSPEARRPVIDQVQHHTDDPPDDTSRNQGDSRGT